MATFGHLAAGLAASRLVGLVDPDRPASRVEAAALALAGEMPDVDFLVPVRHRGRTHSLAFGVLLGVVVAAALAFRNPRRALALGSATAAAGVSHVLLDHATAEAGTASLWPFVRRRVSVPPSPLPAAPIGRSLLTPQGMLSAAGEAAWAAPLALLGLWPYLAPRRRGWFSRR